MKTVTTKALIPALALSMLFLGAGCARTADAPSPAVPSASGGPAAAPDTESATAVIPAPTGTASETKTFTVTAKQWSFDPAEIRVKEGDRVRIEVTSLDVTHGFALPAFKINESYVKGETKVIEFTADKKGSYPFFCSVMCGEGHGQMRGTLIVE